VILCTDATIITETPPLRAKWAPRGTQVAVPIMGSQHKGVLYGALNVRTGAICLDQALKWNQESFQGHLRHLKTQWRGWRIVLFLDRGSPHTAKRSLKLARELGIELRWLPVACPELNPVEGLWRHLKGKALANRPTLWMEELMERACGYIQSLSPVERLRKAGVLSENFWLTTYYCSEVLYHAAGNLRMVSS
jgi:DDE superfamily endonuclease